MKLEPKVTVLARIKPELAERLREQVTTRHITISKWVEEAVESHLDSSEKVCE